MPLTVSQPGHLSDDLQALFSESTVWATVLSVMGYGNGGSRENVLGPLLILLRAAKLPRQGRESPFHELFLD
jgi:hypothetical protein